LRATRHPRPRSRRFSPGTNPRHPTLRRTGGPVDRIPPFEPRRRLENMSNINCIWPSIDDARRALEHEKGSGVKIAVLDSGIETGHPFLEGMSLADDLAI